MENELSIGVDLGGTNMRVALVDRTGKIHRKIKVPTDEDVFNVLVEVVDRIILEGIRITGIGLAVAGLVDSKTQTIVFSPNIRVIEGINITETLENRYNVPVCIENDANLAALGESVAGVGKGFSSFVLLTLGTGIGGGIVLGKKLLPVAAEIGHTVVEAGGRQCGCGREGCFEAYASSRAIMNMVLEGIENGRATDMASHTTQLGDYHTLTPADVYLKYAKNEDLFAIEVLTIAGRYLGIGIANIINALSPEAVILTGGLIEAKDFYLKEAFETASNYALAELYKMTMVMTTKLSDDVGLIGAAHLAFQQADGLK